MSAAVALWPRSAQLALAFLLGVVLTLLAGRAYKRCDTRLQPTELYRLDLNQANRAELLQLPGVGENLAQRIEEHRRHKGAFRSVDELVYVDGIGPTTLERLRPWVTVEPAAYPLADRSAASFADVPKTSWSSIPKPLPPAPIDINSASREELQRLPGIGPTLSQRIIEERHRRPFASVDDLRRVPGIGAKTVEKLRLHAVVTPPARVVTTN
ncbi:MAG: ComEA family DNA-binding protein [Gemmataceae bacterium]